MPINGTNGPDLITGTSGNDDIFGLGGDDTLRGLDGNDTLDGGAGNDTLTGGLGTDILTGGAGTNYFVDTAAGLNGDRITDFLPGDRIQFTDLSATNANFNLVGSTLSFNGGSLLIDSIGPGRLIIRNLSSAGVEVRLQHNAVNDFNGDGRSDILWRDSSGIVTNWLSDSQGGFTPNPSNAWQNVPADWTISGTGDFNGDGREDVLWRSTSTGTVTDWLGTASGGYAPNAANVWEAVPADWRVIGTADFNGDGRTDILWRNTVSNTVTSWLGTASGGFTPNGSAFWQFVPADWKVVGNDDFNGDGVDDILWRNTTTGVLTDWLGKEDGTFTPNAGAVWETVPLDWAVTATGDFNGDGSADVLWRNTQSGVITDWYSTPSGSFSPNAANFWQTVPVDWTVAAVGDFNSDALDDILWRNTNSGVVTDWLAGNNGFTPNAGQFWQTVPTSWHVVSDTFF